jgi:hypothetical protein
METTAAENGKKESKSASEWEETVSVVMPSSTEKGR